MTCSCWRPVLTLVLTPVLCLTEALTWLCTTEGEEHALGRRRACFGCVCAWVLLATRALAGLRVVQHPQRKHGIGPCTALEARSGKRLSGSGAGPAGSGQAACWLHEIQADQRLVVSWFAGC